MNTTYHTDGAPIDFEKLMKDLYDMFIDLTAIPCKVTLISKNNPQCTCEKLDDYDLIQAFELLTSENYYEKAKLLKDNFEIALDEFMNFETFQKRPKGVFIYFFGQLTCDGHSDRGALPLYIDDTDLQLVFSDKKGKTIKHC